MRTIYAGAGAIALAAVLGWTSYQIVAGRASDPYAACRTGAIAGGAIGGAFQLVDETGATVTDAQVFEKPTLVYFGYASCPDVCPLDNSRNVEAAGLLAAQGFDVSTVFISVDPARDTAPVLLEYTDYFGPNLIGLTGTPEQIKQAATAFKVYYKIPDNPEPQYEVDHTTLTYLMLPKIGFAEFFQRDTSAQQIAETTGCFLRAGQA